MSLDVYLDKGCFASEGGTGLFVKENGSFREVTKEEFEQKFPGCELPELWEIEPRRVYEANITHNLAKMAEEAGIYQCLWRPEELGIETAGQLIEPLKKGLALLVSDPPRFKVHNPPNGWGNYEGLVFFVKNYLIACEGHPQAKVSVSR